MLSPAFPLNFGIGQKFGNFLSQAKYAFSAAFLPLLSAGALVPDAKQHLVNNFCNPRAKTFIDLRVRDCLTEESFIKMTGERREQLNMHPNDHQICRFSRGELMLKYKRERGRLSALS